MRKVLAVARAEYASAVRSKAFIIGVILMPVLIGVVIAMQRFMEDRADLSDRRFAIVDHTGKLAAAMAHSAEQRNRHAIHESSDDGGRTQTSPRFVPEVIQPESLAGQDIDLHLSERVRAGELFAFVMIGRGAIDGDAPDAEIAYHTNTPTYYDLPNWLRYVVNDEVRRRRYQGAGLDPQMIARLGRPTTFRQFGLAQRATSGDVVAAEQAHPAQVFLVPGGAMFLLFMLVVLSCPNLLNMVLEEKLNRVSELLVSSVSPFQLMLGKLVGIVAVSGTLGVLYVGAVLFIAARLGVLELIPPAVYCWFPVFLLLALLMYGAIFAAIGSACSEIRDAQGLMTPAMLILMLPMFCWTVVVKSPNSTIAVWSSLFPPATPMLMLLRLAASPAPPWWQAALSVVLTLSFTVLCVWGGAKIFRIGMLSYGQTPTFRKLITWVMAK